MEEYWALFTLHNEIFWSRFAGLYTPAGCEARWSTRENIASVGWRLKIQKPRKNSVMRYLSIFLLCSSIFLLTSCMRKIDPENVVTASAYLNDEISEIILKYSAELKHDRHLYLESFYVFPDENEELVKMRFISQDILEIEQARELLVDFVEGFLPKLNQIPTIGLKNLDIEMVFESYYGCYIDPTYVGYISLKDEMTTYTSFQLYNQNNKYLYCNEEPYFKSLAFVNALRLGEKEYEQEHMKKYSPLQEIRYKGM